MAAVLHQRASCLRTVIDESIAGGLVRYFKFLLTAALMTTLLVTFGPAGQAQAANGTTVAADWEQCVVYFSGNCETDAVQALGGNVVLNLYAPTVGLCYYQVRDVNNWEVVRSSSFWNVSRPTISGLYSWYRLELYSCPSASWGYIEG